MTLYGQDRPENDANLYNFDEGGRLTVQPLPTEEDSPDAVRERYPLLDLADLVNPARPPREWVLMGLIPAKAAISIVGPGGHGKSLLVLALCLYVATGRKEFAGLPIPRQRRVLIVDMENSEDDYADRLASLGVTPRNVTNLAGHLMVLHLPPLPALDTAAGGLELLAVIEAYGIEAGDVVVLDSTQRVTKGNENDSDTIRALYRHTMTLLKRRRVTVIRLDNTGKDAGKGARGSSGKRDDVDVELLLSRPSDGNVQVTVGKSRGTGVEGLVLSVDTDDDGLLKYSSTVDARRQQIARVLHALDGERPDLGERPAIDLVRQWGLRVPRQVIRDAVRERKQTLGAES